MSNTMNFTAASTRRHEVNPATYNSPGQSSMNSGHSGQHTEASSDDKAGLVAGTGNRDNTCSDSPAESHGMLLYRAVATSFKVFK